MSGHWSLCEVFITSIHYIFIMCCCHINDIWNFDFLFYKIKWLGTLWPFKNIIQPVCEDTSYKRVWMKKVCELKTYLHVSKTMIYWFYTYGRGMGVRLIIWYCVNGEGVFLKNSPLYMLNTTCYPSATYTI